MKIEALHAGMRVRHPQYGVGVVKAIAETTADIQFENGRRTVAPEPSGLEVAEPQVSVSGLEIPLAQFIDQQVAAVLVRLGLERPDAAPQQLASRWHRGKMVLHSSDPNIQSKEVPLETFFHKIVMMRNNRDGDRQPLHGSHSDDPRRWSVFHVRPLGRPPVPHL